MIVIIAMMDYNESLVYRVEKHLGNQECAWNGGLTCTRKAYNYMKKRQIEYPKINVKDIFHFS